MTTQRLVTGLCFAVCFSLIGLSLQQEADLRLEAEPRYTQVDRDTLTCTLRDGDGSRVPLAACEFREYYSRAAWNIGTGTATIHNTIGGREVKGILTNPGDAAGSCRLKIEGLADRSTNILGCRVRPASGGAWRYAAMMVLVTGYAPMQYRLQPPGVVVSLPGSDVTIKGEAKHQVDWCSFFLPPNDTGIGLYSERTSENTTRYRLWKEGRLCGVTLLSVQPQHSRFVTSWVWSLSPIRVSADFIELIVATPPVSPPRLLVITTDDTFQAGDMLHATCVVGESRPVANITWLLGGEVVRKDYSNEAPVESIWRWNHDPQMTMQRLSLRLTQLDDGKELKCRAGHLALPSGTLDSNTRIIRVRDPCMPNPCGPYSVCNVTGNYIRCSCLPRHTGSDPHCRPECVGHADCPAEKACVNNTCEKLCPGNCGQDALCRVTNHISSCECPDGYSGDPKTRCEEEPCGMRQTIVSRITGGNNAKKGEFPWQVSIFGIQPAGTHKALCGGTLIKRNMVVTAAHCVILKERQIITLRNSASVKLVLGKLRREWEDDLGDPDVQRLGVETMHVLDGYLGSEDGFQYDIALIKLSTNATLDRKVNVACVDWANTFGDVQLRNGNIGTVTGWGVNLNRVSSTLKWVDLPWVDTKTCRFHTDSDRKRFITRDKFCAGYRGQGRSVCQGDSGGGLLFLNETTNRYYLRGVVSTSLVDNSDTTRCHAEHYTAFTSVGDHIDWIKEQLKGLH